ncbi:SWIM zinc finger family protein [Streptomyces sp. AC627_RSS907]|uniref:SWIM zinc finger family protein n=1 Tax=Streptomyces sp. AC627_RSS907 TaxID=2823684 RepID=UPI001C2375A6|nr:SWIM zinc finger family protein [Streptomyces sp. AC627_RSS907]
MTPARPDTPLPPVAPEVFASVVAGLTTRLRGRLDAAVGALAATPVVATEDGTFRVRCGEDAWVTLTPDPSGTVTDPGQARCTCLLAPRCLHRAAVLGACPVPDAETATRPGDPGRPAGPGDPADPDRSVGPGRTADLGRSPGPDRSAGPGCPAEPGRRRRGRPAGPDHKADTDRGAVPGRPTDRPASPGRPAELVPLASPGRPAEPVPLASPGRPAEPVPPASPGRPAEPPPAAPTAEQVRAACGLWTAAAAVLSAGTAGAGAVLQAELLRAAHTARLAGLHRAENAALGVVRRLRDVRDPHSAHGLAELVPALRDLLLVAHRLKAADPDPALIGTVRHHHRPDGPLRLHGVCREPVIGPGDLGGVVTHFLDDDGRWYTLHDVRPGGPARARRAGTAHVAIRSFLSDHVRLSRGGLIVSGAVVAPDGRLLPENGVRASFAAGRSWTAAASATVFARPAAGTAGGELPAHPAGIAGGAGQARPLTGCAVEIVAADGDELLVRVLTDRGGASPYARPVPAPPVRLAPAHRHPGLAHTANLRRLGAYPGLRIRVLGRIDPDRVTTLRPLAVGPVPGTGATLRLPDEWQGRADLGYDHLQSGHFPPDLPRPSPPAASHTAPPTADPPLWRVRGLLELAVAGGRRAAAEWARDSDRHGHVAALRRGGFVTGAELVATLGAVAAYRSRDVFGRLAEDDQDRYAAQWLATAVHLAGAEAALGRGTWQG